jgi:hypothetical protein
MNPPLILRKNETCGTVNCTLTANKDGVSFADQYALLCIRNKTRPSFRRQFHQNRWLIFLAFYSWRSNTWQGAKLDGRILVTVQMVVDRIR